jgi:anti-sigma factor RsiW
MPSDIKSTDAKPCEPFRDLLGAYLDGELPTDERRRVAAHAEGCAACGEALADYGRIGRSLRQHGRMSASPALAARVRQALDQADADDHVKVAPSVADSMTSRRFWPGSFASRGFAANAAAMAATCLVSVLSTWWVVTSSGQSAAIERDLLNAHIRSLLQDSQVQVASSNQHTVRPWFAGRADFAPAVKDLAADGFPLVGGRLDYVADRRSGVLVYKRHLHIINVFMWPAGSTAEAAPRPATRNGYNLLSWSRNGVTYTAVSDLNSAELRVLQGLL